MSTIRKIRTISTEGMVRQDIEVPEDRLLYGDAILEKVKALFEADPEAKAILVGIDVNGFNSRREEGNAFAALRAAGYGWTLTAFDRRSQYDGVLVTRK